MIDKIVEIIDRNIFDDDVIEFLTNISNINPNMFPSTKQQDRINDFIRNNNSLLTFVSCIAADVLRSMDYSDIKNYINNYYITFSNIVDKDINLYYTTVSRDIFLDRKNLHLQLLLISNLKQNKKFKIYKGMK